MITLFLRIQTMGKEPVLQKIFKVQDSTDEERAIAFILNESLLGGLELIRQKRGAPLEIWDRDFSGRDCEN